DALVRFLATQFLEKQFGVDAVKSEWYRQRLAYASVAQRDGPLARASQLDSTYFGSVPNRGAMFWRLVDRRLGHDNLMTVLRAALTAGKTDVKGLNLPAVREALAARGGESMKALMDQQLDQIIDTDLLIGVPTQRGAEWVSALRNLGSIDVTVTVVATSDRGEQLTTEVTVPAKNFGEVVFKTPAKIVRVEVDPEKFYPQLDYGNDAVPRGKDLSQALNEASLQLGGQDFAKAEATARPMLKSAPPSPASLTIHARTTPGAHPLAAASMRITSIFSDPF